MLSFIFLPRFPRRGDNDPRLFPLDRPMPFSDGRGGPVDDAELNDLSYNDALLDVHVSAYMHTEYDGAKLSEERLAGIFSSLEADVRAANRQLPVRRAQSVSWTQRLTGALRQAVAGPTVSRLAPGAVALALVLSVVGPNMANVLRGEPSSLYSMTLSTPTPEVVDAGAIVTEREKVDLANTRPASPAYEAQALDPYEMHILQRSRTQSQPGAGDSPAVDPFYYQRSGFGPQ